MIKFLPQSRGNKIAARERNQKKLGKSDEEWQVTRQRKMPRRKNVLYACKPSW